MTAPRQVDRPEPGLWALRLAKGGVEVAARIFIAHTTRDPISGDFIDRSPHLAAEINGKPADPYEVWTRRGRPIDDAEFRYLIDDREHARNHRPNDPEANPRKPVSLANIPLPF